MIDKVIAVALREKALVILITLAIVGFGVFAYSKMPVDAFPDISPVMVPVFAEGHGMAPEEMERLVTYPIESAMNGLPGVKQIKSTSAFGMAVIYVYFDDGVDIYFARQLVAERLASAMSDLPEMDEPPILGPISTGLGQIFIYYLKMDKDVDTGGKDPNTYLRDLNDWVVKFQLQTVRGVTDILSIGGHVLQYQIRVDSRALLRYDLSLEDLVEAIRDNNKNVGGQFLVFGSEECLVRGIGLLQELDDIRAIPVKVKDGVAVRVADLGDVVFGNEIRRGVVTHNGQDEVVSGIVLKLFGENTSEVIERLYEKVASVQASLPEGIELIAYYEQAELVKKATWTVKKALVIGAGLVLLTLFVFLGNVRTALIVAASLPICTLVAILCMGIKGLSANLMSLGGIAIAIGMLGDGAIVMVENIHRHLNEAKDGADKDKIVLDAAKQVGRPIFFSIAIIVTVFLPIFTLEGVEGKMFSPMAFTISFALLGSMFTALVVSPALSALLLGQGGHKEFILVRALKWAYRPLLEWAIRLRVLVIGASLAAFVASMFLVGRIGTEFIPTLEEGSILIGAAMPPSISLEKATETIMKIESTILENYPEVDETISRIGRPEAGSHPHPVNYAEVHLELKPIEEWTRFENKQELIEALSKELKPWPGVQLNFTQPIQNAFDELLSGIKAQLAIKVFGEDMDILRAKANEINTALADVEGLVDLSVEQSFGQPQLQVIPDREACSRYGISIAQVQEMVELAVGGEVVDNLYLNTRRYGIHVRFKEEFRANIQAIRDILVHTNDGSLVPLSQVAALREVVGPVQINRENNQRRWIIQGNVRGRDLGGVIADIKARIAERVELPPGYFVEYGGQFENQRRAMARLSIIVPIVIAVVFLMLWMSFDSARDALIIILNVPLALIGGIVGLFLMKEYLSVPASVGFIALLGIAVQNGVVLVSYINELRDRDFALHDALVQGGMLRLRPVLMTALTTILGLMPLLLSHGIGSEVQRPLAIVVVFGLASSTLLTLFVIPAGYGLLAGKRKK